MNDKRHLVKISLLIFFAAVSFAAAELQNVRVTGSVDKERATIGDPVTYTVVFNSSRAITPVLPQKTEELGPWSVIDVRAAQLNDPPQPALIYTLAAFTTGTLVIPALTVSYTDENNAATEVKTGPASVTIESVIDKYGEASDIRDIKPPLSLPLPLLTYAAWLLATLALAGGAYYIYNKYFRKTAPKDPLAEAPAEPPYQRALRALEELARSSLIDEGKVKEFYVLLFDIMRDYFSGSYRIETRDRTTGEIYAQLKKAEPDKKILTLIKEFLETCDLVKFAKYRPGENTCRADIQTARRIVEETDLDEPQEAGEAPR